MTDSSTDRVKRKAAELDKVYNEENAQSNEQAANIDNQNTQDQIAKLSDNLKAQLVGISRCIDCGLLDIEPLLNGPTASSSTILFLHSC